MRTEVRQRLAERRFRLDAVVNAAYAASLELFYGQLGVSRDVLDNQYAQVQWHPVLRGRSRHPQRRRLPRWR